MGMYVPAHFREERLEVLHHLIRSHALATLVTYGADGITANHIPMVLDPHAGAFGSLRGHLSRANPQWQTADLRVPALAIFQGPDHYISPSWYPSKQDHGRAVPTWNFAVVHAYGVLRIQQDAEWLRQNVTALTDQQEAAFQQPWHVTDAPAEFVEGTLKGIVGVELLLDRIEGKWKVSQNRTDADRAGVIHALEATRSDAAEKMADLCRRALDSKTLP